MEAWPCSEKRNRAIGLDVNSQQQLLLPVLWFLACPFSSFLYAVSLFLSVSLVLRLYLSPSLHFLPTLTNSHSLLHKPFFFPGENVGHRSDSRKAARSWSRAALLLFPAFCSCTAAEDSTHVCVCVCVCVFCCLRVRAPSWGTNHSTQQPVLRRLQQQPICFNLVETRAPARPTAEYQRWSEPVFNCTLGFVITLICLHCVNPEPPTLVAGWHRTGDVDVARWLQKHKKRSYPFSKQTHNHTMWVDDSPDDFMLHLQNG